MAARLTIPRTTHRPVLESTHPMRGKKDSNQGRRERADESKGRWGHPGYGCPVVDHPDLSSGFGWTDHPEVERFETAAGRGARHGFYAHPPLGLTCRPARSWFSGPTADFPCLDMPSGRKRPWAWTLLILGREWVCLGSSVPGRRFRPHKGVMAT